MSYTSEDKEIDNANRAYAAKQDKMTSATYNLKKAKADSKFWSSLRGTANKLPSAMGDTARQAFKRMSGK